MNSGTHLGSPPREYNSHLAIPMSLHHKTLPMHGQTQTWHPFNHHHLPPNMHTIPPKTWAYGSLNSHFVKIVTPFLLPKGEKSMYGLMVDTLENATWYGTLNILTTCIQRGIHTNNITNLFEECYIMLLPIHACVQQIHMITIKSLTLVMLNKCKLENHQQSIFSTQANPIIHSHNKTSWLNLTTWCPYPIN